MNGSWREKRSTPKIWSPAHHFVPNGKRKALCGTSVYGDELDKAPNYGRCNECKNKFRRWYEQNSGATSQFNAVGKAVVKSSGQQVFDELPREASSDAYTLQGRLKKPRYRPCAAPDCSGSIPVWKPYRFCYKCFQSGDGKAKAAAEKQKKIDDAAEIQQAMLNIAKRKREMRGR